METLLKFLPFMPEKNDGGKLAIALVFYLLVPPLAAGIVGFVLGLTIILAPVALVVGLAASAYTILGVVFAILSYTGYDFAKKEN